MSHVEGIIVWESFNKQINPEKNECPRGRPKMKRRQWKIAILFICLHVLIFSGCGLQSPVPEKNIAASEIRIGAVLPLSGPEAGAAREGLNGMLLAAEIINEEIQEIDIPLAKTKGIPTLSSAMVRIIPVDYQGKAENAGNETEKVIISDKCDALIAPISNQAIRLAANVAERYGIPMIDAFSSETQLSRNENLWLFKIGPDDSMLPAMFHPFILTLKEKDLIQEGKFAFIHAGDVLTTEAASLAIKQASVNKYNVVFQNSIMESGQKTDPNLFTRKIKASGASILWQYMSSVDSVELIKSYKAADFNPEGIILPGGFDSASQKNMPKDSRYIMVMQYWSPDLKDKKVLYDKLNQRYKKKFGSDMGETAIRGFTAVLVISDAINRAGSAMPDASRKALELTDLPGKQLLMPWKGIRFDPRTHQNRLASGVIVQLRENGRVTIWPPESAAGQIIWPMPRWKERDQESQ